MAILNSAGKREGVELTMGKMVHRGAGHRCGDGVAVSAATSPCWEKNSGGGQVGPELIKILSLPLIPCLAPWGLRELRVNPCLLRTVPRLVGLTWSFLRLEDYGVICLANQEICSCVNSSMAPHPLAGSQGWVGVPSRLLTSAQTRLQLLLQEVLTESQSKLLITP